MAAAYEPFEPTAMPRALISGITGQDGSYLAEFPELVRIMVNADMREIETRLRGGAAALRPEPSMV